MKPQTVIKLAAKRILALVPTPGWTTRYPNLNRLERFKIKALCQILLKETGYVVYGGPFATMQLSDSVALSWDSRMIVGSYEEEVHGVINDVICMAPPRIIDIGASFGYYTVGLALKIANTAVIAFESVEDPHWQHIAKLAEINGVSSKIIQRGFCTPAELAEVCGPNSFIICDCEGGEEDLLLPREIPVLKSCKILVELHEFSRPNLVATLVDRFHESHTIRIIEESERNPNRYPILKKLPRSWRPIAIEETRWIRRESVRTTTWLRFMVLDPK